MKLQLQKQTSTKSCWYLLALPEIVTAMSIKDPLLTDLKGNVLLLYYFEMCMWTSLDC